MFLIAGILLLLSFSNISWYFTQDIKTKTVFVLWNGLRIFHVFCALYRTLRKVRPCLPDPKLQLTTALQDVHFLTLWLLHLLMYLRPIFFMSFAFQLFVSKWSDSFQVDNVNVFGAYRMFLVFLFVKCSKNILIYENSKEYDVCAICLIFWCLQYSLYF